MAVSQTLCICAEVHAIKSGAAVTDNRNLVLQKKEVLGRLNSQLGNPTGSLLVSPQAFQHAVVQHFGSAAFAQHLYQSQDPGADMHHL